MTYFFEDVSKQNLNPQVRRPIFLHQNWRFAVAKPWICATYADDKNSAGMFFYTYFHMEKRKRNISCHKLPLAQWLFSGIYHGIYHFLAIIYHKYPLESWLTVGFPTVNTPKGWPFFLFWTKRLGRSQGSIRFPRERGISGMGFWRFTFRGW